MDQLAIGVLKAAAIAGLIAGVILLLVIGEGSPLMGAAAGAGGFVAFGVLWSFATLVSDVRRWVGEPEGSKGGWERMNIPAPNED